LFFPYKLSELLVEKKGSDSPEICIFASYVLATGSAFFFSYVVKIFLQGFLFLKSQLSKIPKKSLFHRHEIKSL